MCLPTFANSAPISVFERTLFTHRSSVIFLSSVSKWFTYIALQYINIDISPLCYKQENTHTYILVSTALKVRLNNLFQLWLTWSCLCTQYSFVYIGCIWSSKLYKQVSGGGNTNQGNTNQYKLHGFSIVRYPVSLYVLGIDPLPCSSSMILSNLEKWCNSAIVFHYYIVFNEGENIKNTLN